METKTISTRISEELRDALDEAVIGKTSVILRAALLLLLGEVRDDIGLRAEVLHADLAEALQYRYPDAIEQQLQQLADEIGVTRGTNRQRTRQHPRIIAIESDSPSNAKDMVPTELDSPFANEGFEFE